MRLPITELRGPVRLLGVLHLFDAFGNGIFLGGSAVYLTQVVGLSATQVGIGLSLAGLAGLASSTILGVVADRMGARPTLSIVLFAGAAAYLLYPLVLSPLSFFVLAAMIGALEWGCGPSFISLIAEFTPERKRVRVRAILRVLFNVGFGLGSLTAAVLTGANSELLIRLFPVINAATFVVAAILVLRLPKVDARPIAPGSARFKALRDVPFLRVVGVTTILALQTSVLTVGIPLWIVVGTGLPKPLAPALIAVNAVAVVALQVRASRGAESRQGATRVARLAGLAGCAGCVVLAASAGLPPWATLAVVLAGVVALTAAELWQVASAFSLGFELAPDDRRAEYLGAFQMTTVAQSIAGPVMVAALVGGGSGTGWLVVAALFGLGGVLIGPAVAAVPRKTADRERAYA